MNRVFVFHRFNCVFTDTCIHTYILSWNECDIILPAYCDSRIDNYDIFKIKVKRNSIVIYSAEMIK